MDEVIRRLCDESDIRRLIFTWMNGLDNRKYDDLTTSWTDLIEVEYNGFPSGAPVQSGTYENGRSARGIIRMLSEFDATQHVNTNHLITIDGDRAACSCYMIATHHMSIDSGEPWSTIGARYDLDAVRLEVGWRLTKLRWTRMWTSGNDGLWSEVFNRMRARKVEAQK